MPVLSTYTYPRYAYRRPAELDQPGVVARHPVIVIGAGPVGLAAAIDLAQRGVPVLLLDDDDTYMFDFLKRKYLRYGCSKVAPAAPK